MNAELERLAGRFTQFAAEARDLNSPLYAELASRIAADEESLALAQHVRRPPAENVLLGAVHFLLMEAPEHALARFYGSLSADSVPADGAYPAFRDFLLSNRSRVIPLLETRITQTNEVTRCSYLLPAFTLVHQAAEGRPLALIDVGCSAGLHLLWDRYFYDYGHVRMGNPDASVVIKSELRGSVRPPIGPRFPDCAFRVGIDLNPVDLADPDERRWFEALIWPEHHWRRRLARAAIAELRRHPPRIIKGDAVDVLRQQLEAAPVDAALVVFNCHALCQASHDDLDAIANVMTSHSSRRQIDWLFCEGFEVTRRIVREGRIAEWKLANKDGHGRWLEWLA